MARSGLSDLITRLRNMTATGSADYTVGALTYWTDAQLQDVLDRNRKDIRDEKLFTEHVIGTAGTAQWFDYQSKYDTYEQTTGGTSIFYLAFSDGERVGTAEYTVDYARGAITFTNDTGGSALYLNGRAYDLSAAASEIWTMKADHVADRYDFSADGARHNMSQIVEQYMQRAERYARYAKWGNRGVGVSTLLRTDMR